MAAATVEAPTTGAYLTDGKRLVEVIGVDRDGSIVLDDCAADLDRPAPTFAVTPDELLRDWKLVRAE